MIKELILIFTAGAAVDEYILGQLVGVYTPTSAIGRVKRSCSLGFALTAVLLVSTLLSYPMCRYILVPLELEYLTVVIFSLVSTGVCLLSGKALSKLLRLPLELSVISLLGVNSAVLGMLLGNLSLGYGFWQSVLSAAGIGIGFVVTLILLSGALSRSENKNIPESFRGLPIIAISAALVSLAFYGLAGIAENIIGKL